MGFAAGNERLRAGAFLQLPEDGWWEQGTVMCSDGQSVWEEILSRCGNADGQMQTLRELKALRVRGRQRKSKTPPKQTSQTCFWKRACKPHGIQRELHPHGWGKKFPGTPLAPTQNSLFATMRYHPPPSTSAECLYTGIEFSLRNTMNSDIWK